MKTIERMVSEIAKPGNMKCHHSPWSSVELFCAQKRIVPQLTLFGVAEAEELERGLVEDGLHEDEGETRRRSG